VRTKRRVRAMIAVTLLCLLACLSACAQKEKPADGAIIADPGLRAAIREALEFNHDQPLTEEALAELRILNARRMNIEHLDGLESCVNLTALSLWDNQIRDLSRLSPLTKLEYLDLDGNGVEDLSPLGSLQALSVLYVSQNPVSELSPLADLRALRTLFLNEVAVDDWNEIRHLKQVEVLSVEGNKITDAAPFLELPQLRRLSLAGNRVANLDVFADVSTLEVLIVSYNELETLGGIGRMSGLCSLDLSNNRIADLDPLATLGLGECDAARRINLSNNQIADASALTSIQDLAPEDVIDLRGNPVASSDMDALIQTLQALRASGVEVLVLSPLETGQEAPEFELPHFVSGEPVALSDYAGQLVVLDFWASWCGPCRAAMPQLEDMVTEFEDEIALLGVNLDRSDAEARDYLETASLEQMVVLGGDFEAAEAVSLRYGDLLANGIPHTFVIGADGIILYSGHPLGIEPRMLETWVSQLP